MKIKAIDTVYKGYRFRSRLEARWAVFFDALGVEWVYEPEGFELPDGSRYLPDFFIYIDKSIGLRAGSGYWVEIKGQEPSSDEINKLSQLCQLTDHTGYIFSGLPSEKSWICCHRLGSIHENGRDDEEVPWMKEFHFEMAIQWSRCAPYNNAVKKAVKASRSARFEHGERG